MHFGIQKCIARTNWHLDLLVAFLFAKMIFTKFRNFYKIKSSKLTLLRSLFWIKSIQFRVFVSWRAKLSRLSDRRVIPYFNFRDTWEETWDEEEKYWDGTKSFIASQICWKRVSISEITLRDLGFTKLNLVKKKKKSITWKNHFRISRKGVP